MQPRPACDSGRCTICLIGVSIKPAVEERRVVAPAAPLRRLGADRILHVLDRLAIPLIVERRKMMRRTEPLVVDIFVAALAGVGLHEKLAGNFLLAVDLRGTGEKRAFGPIAFAVHVVGRHGGILDAGAGLPTFAHVARAVADAGEHDQADCHAKSGMSRHSRLTIHALPACRRSEGRLRRARSRYGDKAISIPCAACRS